MFKFLGHNQFLEICAVWRWCYFMIMVLSCCDLLVVLTSQPLMVFISMLCLTGIFDTNLPSWVRHALELSNVLQAFSLVALLLINFGRYLEIYHPFFHRKSVTKGRLLTLFAISIIFICILALLCVESNVIRHHIGLLVVFAIFTPPMLFINYKLFIIAWKGRRNDRISPVMKKFCLKYLSSSLLAIACFVILSIPTFVYIGLRANLKYMSTLDDANIAGLWAKTIFTMNSTLNCIIFYWKNKILRTVGKNVIRSIKSCSFTQ